MIIIYIARSIGRSGHIVSQLANDLLVFHKNAISFTLISPCDFKIDLRLELLGLSNNANSGSLQSMYKTLAAVISVDLESNLFTNHLTTKTITNSSCEICEKEGGEAVGLGQAFSEFLKVILNSGMAQKTCLFIPWWGIHTIEELQEIGHLADKNKIEIVIRGEISDVIRRKKNLFNDNGKKLLLANEIKSVKKILFFDSSPKKKLKLPLEYRRKLHFVPVTHSNVHSKIKTSSVHDLKYTIGFYGLLSYQRGLGIFTYLALINPKIRFEAYGNNNSNKSNFNRVNRIPLIGGCLHYILGLILKFYAQCALNLDQKHMVWINSTEYNNQILNVHAVFSAGNRSYLASGLSLTALGLGTPVLFTAGNSANSELLMENFPQGKLSVLDFLVVNKLSAKIEKIGELQAFMVHSHEEYSRNFLSAFHNT